MEEDDENDDPAGHSEGPLVPRAKVRERSGDENVDARTHRADVPSRSTPSASPNSATPRIRRAPEFSGRIFPNRPPRARITV